MGIGIILFVFFVALGIVGWMSNCAWKKRCHLIMRDSQKKERQRLLNKLDGKPVETG